MGGLLFFGVIFLWLGVAIFLARRNRFTEGMAPGRNRQLMTLLLMVILIPLPVADEIIGGFQFRALCDKCAVQYIDEKNAQDRKVIQVGLGKDWYEKYTILKTHIQPYIYEDVETRKVLVSHHNVKATGGVLMRSILGSGAGPLTFTGTCWPTDDLGFRQKFNITIVDK